MTQIYCNLPYRKSLLVHKLNRRPQSPSWWISFSRHKSARSLPLLLLAKVRGDRLRALGIIVTMILVDAWWWSSSLGPNNVNKQRKQTLWRRASRHVFLLLFSRLGMVRCMWAHSDLGFCFAGNRHSAYHAASYVKEMSMCRAHHLWEFLCSRDLFILDMELIGSSLHPALVCFCLLP